MIDSQSDWTVADKVAVEAGTITHGGRSYTSGGAAIDFERGRAVVYVKLEPGRANACLSATTWDGEIICALTRTDRGMCYVGNTALMSYQTKTPLADGYYYYGRGLGAGMLLHLRRGRKAK